MKRKKVREIQLYKNENESRKTGKEQRQQTPARLDQVTDGDNRK